MLGVRVSGVVAMRGVRGVLVLVAAVVLCSCGPAGSDALSPVDTPPYGAETVAWPSTGPDITALLEALPAQVDGLVGQAVESREDPPSVSREYGTDTFVNAEMPGPTRETVIEVLGSHLFWMGGRAGCLDWTSSPALMPQDLHRAEVEAAISAGTEFVWWQCKAVLAIDQGGTLPPDEWFWVFGFVSGEQVYTVWAKSDAARRELAQALVSTAGQRPWQ